MKPAFSTFVTNTKWGKKICCLICEEKGKITFYLDMFTKYVCAIIFQGSFTICITWSFELGYNMKIFCSDFKCLFPRPVWHGQSYIFLLPHYIRKKLHIYHWKYAFEKFEANGNSYLIIHPCSMIPQISFFLKHPSLVRMIYITWISMSYF